MDMYTRVSKSCVLDIALGLSLVHTGNYIVGNSRLLPNSATVA